MLVTLVFEAHTVLLIYLIKRNLYNPNFSEKFQYIENAEQFTDTSLFLNQ